ncbi:Endonuclease/exonuclease/phosphatase [Macrophomina phaseolina MS6]|uniref:Endonuclease/exonuclease/phosphatase n=2 Tax=Macrophomina phaseolina TaxID=35725 RepID=K2S5I9_MACPH|nr:Endonuclease/exonuclease/phosphatase [Macrophomina phaseolina MS6]KAH7064764.1 endonuclease/exonuclease/phosphatase family protein [Macrophomina phaseolina]
MGYWQYLNPWGATQDGSGTRPTHLQDQSPAMLNFVNLPLRFLTHNIRYATTGPFAGEELWPVRAPGLINELRFHTNALDAFIGLQECLNGQLIDIMDGLNNQTSSSASYSQIESTGSDEWAYLGVGRNDGKEAGEYSPIIYRPAIWEVVDYQYFWLSETPNVPSKGWDAGSIRIVTIGHFRHRESSREFLMLNTHLDNAGSVSRQKSAELIITFINNYLSKYGNGTVLPVILTGDFNSETSGEAYQYLSSPPSVVRDIRDSVAPSRWYGNENTFTGFSEADGPPTRIDFIFAGPVGNTTSAVAAYKDYAVLANKFDDGVYISDHRAVVGDVVL